MGRALLLLYATSNDSAVQCFLARFLDRGRVTSKTLKANFLENNREISVFFLS